MAGVGEQPPGQVLQAHRCGPKAGSHRRTGLEPCCGRDDGSSPTSTNHNRGGLMFRRVATFLRKRKVEQDLDDELQASVHLLAEEHIAKGVSPPSAAGERT